ncbi:MAG: hypothetical protein KIS85_02300 [Anaerolineales bacterium]|nr:hypothetical protein [Anaerolineales bacterium]
MSQVSAQHTHIEEDDKDMPPVVQFGTLVIGVPLLLTAVRCTLQYIVVPFVLPMMGVTNTFSPLINVGAGVLSIGVILFNVKTLWNTNWRTRYLLLALVFIPIIVMMTYSDYQAYLAISGQP